MHIERNKPESVPPLGAPLETPETETPPRTPAYPESLKRIFRNRENLYWEIETTGFHGGPAGRRKGYRLAAWSLVASMIDALLLVAMSCIFMMAFIKIIRMPITPDLLHDFAILYVIGAWLYMITTRFFIGSSIGEAACDLRLGKPQERLSSRYFAKVILRTSLIMLTGVILLPTLSLILGTDIPGKLTGLKLWSL